MKNAAYPKIQKIISCALIQIFIFASLLSPQDIIYKTYKRNIEYKLRVPMGIDKQRASISRHPDPEEVFSNLSALSQNLWFEWHYKAKELFRSMDSRLWHSEEVNENPSLFLQRFGIDGIRQLAANIEFINSYIELMTAFNDYMNPDKETWVSVNYPQLKGKLFAYSSFEYGVGKATQNLQSGGLGALSGDHLKEMSDMGFECIAIGIGYKQGYFIQRINAEGNQETVYNDADFSRMPKKKAIDPETGEPLMLKIDMYSDTIHVRVWEVNVGRIKLYLLDSDIDENGKDDETNWKRKITKSLYGQNKFHQAYLLGIGEATLLDKLKVKIDFFHLNESHSAFAIIGQIKSLVEKAHLTFEQATVVMYYKTLFTIHTPIPAGNWSFSPAETVWAFNSDFNRYLDIGVLNFLGEKQGNFNLAQFLLNSCWLKNGVSKEHGSVSREQWKGYAIGEILNGVSKPYWQTPELQELIRNKIEEAKSAQHGLSDEGLLNEAITNISDKELWDIHMAAKKRLVQFVRTSVQRQRTRNNESLKRIVEAETLFKEGAFTIGVARRFAPYKRSDWLFTGDIERIKRIFNKALVEKKPIQVIFAGKAHPEDVTGQIIIRRINDYIKQLEDAGIEGQIVFLENYNLDMAHYLEQGCDLWLSHPVTDYLPEEASATSGEKAALNGVINAGVPTGFMRKDLVHGVNAILFNHIVEFYEELNLENSASAINLYYGKDEKPSKKWISMIRESLRIAMFRFGTDRMIQDYTRRYYLRGVEVSERIEANNYALAREVANALQNPDVLLEKVTIGDISLGMPISRIFKTDGTYDPIEVEADIRFDENTPPEAIEVSIIFKQGDRPDFEQAIEMVPLKDMGNGIWRYAGVIDTLLRVDFLNNIFKPDTRDFRLGESLDCSYRIRVRPILEKIIQVNGENGEPIYEKKWPEKISTRVGHINILPNAQLASGQIIEEQLSAGVSAGRSDL